VIKVETADADPATSQLRARNFLSSDALVVQLSIRSAIRILTVSLSRGLGGSHRSSVADRSRARFHPGIFIRGFSSGNFHPGITVRGLLCGDCCTGIAVRGLLYGDYCTGISVWGLLCGSQVFGNVSRRSASRPERAANSRTQRVTPLKRQTMLGGLWRAGRSEPLVDSLVRLRPTVEMAPRRLCEERVRPVENASCPLSPARSPPAD
jgi:hypothetical protein